MRHVDQISQAISHSRRQFLRTVTGAGAAATLFGPATLRALAAPRNRKAVVVTFGGGARDDETFAPDGQENIPHLLRDLVTQPPSIPTSSTKVSSGTTSPPQVSSPASTRPSTTSPPSRPTIPQSSSTSARISSAPPPMPGSSRPVTASPASAKAAIRSTARASAPASSYPSDSFPPPCPRSPMVRATSTSCAITTRRLSTPPASRDARSSSTKWRRSSNFRSTISSPTPPTS